MNKSSTLLVIVAVALGLNLGYMLAKRDGRPIPVLPAAHAGQVITTPAGEIMTTNQEGNKLYLWYNTRSNAPSDVYKAVEFKL